MEKIKLMKRSENVNINYNNEGEGTQSLNSASYELVNESTGDIIGSADAYSGRLNINIHGVIDSTNAACDILERMFNAFATEEE